MAHTLCCIYGAALRNKHIMLDRAPGQMHRGKVDLLGAEIMKGQKSFDSLSKQSKQERVAFCWKAA